MSLESLKTKVGLLIEKAQSGGGLPDWDDDSPIIATGVSHETSNVTWELTEKGTFRWKIIDLKGKKTATLNHQYPHLQPADYRAIRLKIKQVYISDGITNAHLFYAVNCERVRVPATLTNNLGTNSCISLKEIDYSGTSVKTTIGDYYYNWHCSLEKFVDNKPTTVISAFAFSNCYSLKEINLDYVISFNDNCFNECIGLAKPIVFSAELTYIGNNSFNKSGITELTFQTPTTGVYPTIVNTSFANCADLTNVHIPSGWNVSLYFPQSPLTQECLHAMIENFADMTGQTAPTFQIGNTNIAKIDEEHINLLLAKNWIYK